MNGCSSTVAPGASAVAVAALEAPSSSRPPPPAPGRRARGSALTFLALVAACGLAAPGTARAQPCDGAVRWAATCPGDEVTIEVERCIAGGVIVATSVGGEASINVEIVRSQPRAFQQVGDLGVSPIGEFADWASAPETVHRAFAAVVTCLETNPALDVPEGRLTPGGDSRTPDQLPVPWLLVGAFLLAAAALGLALRGRRPSGREILVAAGPPVLVAVGAYVVRAMLTDPAFVHQNGQGPLWVTHALCVTPAYGPGYLEVFGWATRILGGEPSAAVFTIQAVLAAASVAGTWLIARGASVRLPLAAAVTAVVALEPALARLAQSESYFATISSLLLMAGGLISMGARRGRPTDPVYLLTVAAAALLVAQAARVHPVAWVPAALIPLVVLVGRGRLRSRFVLTATATIGIGVTSAIFAVTVIASVAGGDVGDQWLPNLLSRVPLRRLTWGLAAGLAGGVLIALAARRRWRGVVRGTTFFAVVAVAFSTHLINAVGPLIVSAYLLLFLPAFVAALGTGIDGALRRRRAGWVAAAGLVVATSASASWRAHELWVLPTDALEQQWVLDHRGELPEGASVAFLGSAGPRRRLHLPLYGLCEAGPNTAELLAAEGTPRDLTTLPHTVVWYRSSLCTTSEGHDYCDAVEARYRLTPIVTTDLPARASMEGLGYDDGTVHVGLYTLGGTR